MCISWPYQAFPHLHWCIWLPIWCMHHQEGNPVEYYSKKLYSAQMNYVTIDKELLCAVATLPKFHSMLFGAELHIHTDHQNILSIGDSSQWRLCWISCVDEYGPGLHYVEGPHNLIADTFSRLLQSDMTSPLVGKKASKQKWVITFMANGWQKHNWLSYESSMSLF